MQFIEQLSKRNHPTIKFTAEISETETFLDTNIYKVKDSEAIQFLMCVTLQTY